MSEEREREIRPEPEDAPREGYRWWPVELYEDGKLVDRFWTERPSVEVVELVDDVE